MQPQPQMNMNQQHINLNEIISERYLAEKLFQRDTELLMLAETNKQLQGEIDSLKKEIEKLKSKK